MQSKPLFEKQADVLFLGYNANENFGYVPVDKERFYNGNTDFYKRRYGYPWKVWYRLYNAFKWAEFLKPVSDDNFIYMNAVYFGSNDIKSILGHKEAIQQCFDFTGELIQDIFKPKNIICFSIDKCFNVLSKKYGFTNVKTITPLMVDGNPSSKTIKKAKWNGISVYGIPHPSRASNDMLGAIALFFKKHLP